VKNVDIIHTFNLAHITLSVIIGSLYLRHITLSVIIGSLSEPKKESQLLPDAETL